MEIRKLTSKEKAQAGFVSSFCFHNRFDEELEKKEDEWMQSVTEIWGAIEDNKVMSVVYNNKFECYYDGNKIPMFGVGGVSTLPEYRNKGCSRQIITKMLKEEYKKGTVISSLFPFNTSFYRKFGYDVACEKNVYTFKPAFLKDYTFNGEVIMYKPGDDYSSYIKLYDEFIKNFNLGACRNEVAWNWKMPKDVFKHRKFAYLLRENNEDIAYIIFKDKEGEEAIIDIQEMVWKNNGGFTAILGFLARFNSDYGTIKMPLPPTFELNSIIHSPIPYESEKELHLGYMVRAVNAKKALELMNKPKCSFTIQINDNIIKENNNIFKVTDNNVEVSNENPDIVVSIEAFSQLVFGVISYQEAILREDVKVLNNIETLKSVFVKKHFIVNQFF